ncbi:CAP domain-containing protein [Candidatus Parcubacteria bacterium]|jgi:uncharacterized protein YkwD|nr:MAG: CAP domain-containing protein [Candidatus Parcubacteria bacterium]
MKTEKNSNDNPLPKRMIHRVKHHAKHWFIPHEGNNHQPHALRTRALKIYAYILISAKIASAVFLFAAFPNQAEYAAYTASTIISLTNESRQNSKLNALTSNPKLVQAALNKAKDMLSKNYFAHTTPEGKRFWTWIDSTGYDYAVAGENLAIDFTTPEAAHSALMASTSHRENILNKRYKEIGVAVVTGAMDGVETTVLVEMFGTQVAKKTPVAKVTTPKPKKVATTAPPKQTSTAPKPSTQPKVQAEVTALPKGDFIQQSQEKFTLFTGAAVEVWAEFKNTGDSAWKPESLKLATTEPKQRESALADASWESKSTIASLETEVAPKGVTRFEWKIKAPDQAGSNLEKFSLFTADGTQVPNTVVDFEINTVAPTAVAQVQEPQIETQAGAPIVPETASTPEIISQEVTKQAPNDIVSKLMNFVDNFYLGVLLFLAIALAINIFVKIRVQHAHIIGQTLAVIAIASGFLLMKFHFLQKIAPAVKVLGKIWFSV